MDASLFLTVLEKMAFLLLLMAIGFLLAKTKIVGKELTAGLSRLENYVLIPALVTSTFIERFTKEMLSSAGFIFLGSLAVEAVVIAVTLVLVRFMTRDAYQRKIYRYGLCFSNFGFVGYAVVLAVIPEYKTEYLVFTLALWAVTDVWGMPSLVPDGEEKITVAARLKKLCNPMFIGMIIGMVLGVTAAPVPAFLGDALDALAACMSPVALLLSGMIIASVDFKKVLRVGAVYWITALRLFVYPLAFFGAAKLFGFSPIFTLIGTAAMAMPFGLNAIVIPTAYRQDVQVGSGMVLVSHLLSVVSIPFVMWLISVL